MSHCIIVKKWDHFSDFSNIVLFIVGNGRLWLLGIKRKCRSRFFVIFWTVNATFPHYFKLNISEVNFGIEWFFAIVLKTWLISWHFFGMNRKCQISEAQLVAQSSKKKKSSKQCGFCNDSFHCESILRLRFFFHLQLNFTIFSHIQMVQWCIKDGVHRVWFCAKG